MPDASAGLQSIVKNSITPHTTGLKTIKEPIHKQASAMFYKNAMYKYKHIRDLGHTLPAPTQHNEKLKSRPLA